MRLLVVVWRVWRLQTARGLQQCARLVHWKSMLDDVKQQIRICAMRLCADHLVVCCWCDQRLCRLACLCDLIRLALLCSTFVGCDFGSCRDVGVVLQHHDCQSRVCRLRGVCPSLYEVALNSLDHANLRADQRQSWGECVNRVMVSLLTARRLFAGSLDSCSRVAAGVCVRMS